MIAEYRHVCLDSLAVTLPAEKLTSAAIEEQLADVYERLHFPAGRLEMMTGIRERRLFPKAKLPSEISSETARSALQDSTVPTEKIGLVVHGSVCRDRLEPATACAVHHACGLEKHAPAIDASNACLGLLDGIQIVADRIEAGQIEAGLVVGTELARDLIESTISWLANSPDIARRDVKRAFASLTIGSASAALVLCRRELASEATQLREVVSLSETSQHHLCAGGTTADASTLMETDSEALLEAGINLAAETWSVGRDRLNWSSEFFDRFVTHQVGRAHRAAMYERLGLKTDRDFPTVEFLGNTGSTALPAAAALAVREGTIAADQNVGWLGIGSGLNCSILNWKWQQTRVAVRDLAADAAQSAASANSRAQASA